jgi:hypothetical protein
MKIQNKAKYPHFQSNIKGSPEKQTQFKPILLSGHWSLISGLSVKQTQTWTAQP